MNAEHRGARARRRAPTAAGELRRVGPTRGIHAPPRLGCPIVGDCFQKLGDLDATADEAQDLAAGALAWLVAEEIVSGELTDCALGGLASPPGRCRVKALRDAGDADGVDEHGQRRRQRLTG